MVWPFTRSWPLGLAGNQVPSHVDLNKLDEQVAQAADGSIWTDVALVANLFPAETFAGAGSDVIGQALIFEPTIGRWWSFGATAANVATGFMSYDGANWLNTSLSTDTPTAEWGAATAAAVSPTGVIVVGGQTTANHTHKSRVSLDAGASWLTVDTVNSAGPFHQPACLAWAPSGACFVAGFSNTDVGNVETFDGSAWVQRTAPNNRARRAVAAGPANAVMLSAASTNTCIWSADGVTWVARSMPLSTQWIAVTWSDVRQKYMAISAAGNVALSTDGITWSVSGTTAPLGAGTEMGLTTVGRLWVVAAGNYLSVSSDDGASWRVLSNFAMPSGFKMAGTGRQLLIADGNVTRRSLRGGF